MNHWAIPYIGHPYEAGGKYDCWTFFQHVQHKHFNRKMPDIILDDYKTMNVKEAFQTNSTFVNEVKSWHQIDLSKVREGCAVLLAQLREPHHIGVWIETETEKGIIHCTTSLGVIFTSDIAMRASRWRIIGVFDCE